MKTLVATLALVLVCQVQAQTNHGTNLQQAQAAADASGQPAPANGPSIAPGQSSGNPIYILNNQRIHESQQATQGQSAAQAAVQEQPTSIIQEAPLKASPADQMRRKRQDAEVQTEDGIVQALEKARIDDELRRRDKFNNAIAPVNQAASQQTNGASVVGDNNTVQQSNVVQQPQVQVVPAPQPVKKARSAQEELDEEDAIIEKPARKSEPKEEKVDIRGEIRAAMAESSAKKIEDEKQSYYVAALASFGTYYDVVNVDRSLGYGVAVGTVTPERFVVEGVFMYADYHIAEMYSFGPYGSGGGGYYNGPYSPGMVNMRQYTFGAAAKYQFLPGKFRPVAGALLNYNRRNYSYDQYGSFRSTDAIDVGALVGADLQLTPGFALGVDFRYNTNLGYRSSNPGEAFSYQAANNPEKLDYYTVNLIGKFTF